MLKNNTMIKVSSFNLINPSLIGLFMHVVQFLQFINIGTKSMTKSNPATARSSLKKRDLKSKHKESGQDELFDNGYGVIKSETQDEPSGSRSYLYNSNPPSESQSQDNKEEAELDEGIANVMKEFGIKHNLDSKEDAAVHNDITTKQDDMMLPTVSNTVTSLLEDSKTCEICFTGKKKTNRLVNCGHHVHPGCLQTRVLQNLIG